MKIDPDKFTQDESRSNPMVAAMKYEDCPVNQICFFIAMGAPTNMCPHFQAEGEGANCTKQEG